MCKGHSSVPVQRKCCKKRLMWCFYKITCLGLMTRRVIQKLVIQQLKIVHIIWSRELHWTKIMATNIARMHCSIHRQALASICMHEWLKSLLDDALTLVNFINARPMNEIIFEPLCEKSSTHNCLLTHTKCRWLLCGKILTASAKQLLPLNIVVSCMPLLYFSYN
jgi:hypothetical protein